MTDAVLITGFRGRQVPNRRTVAGGSWLAILFPGLSYPCRAPLLHYSRMLLAELGADVLEVDYGYDRLEGFVELSDEQQDRIFEREVQAAATAGLAAGRYRRVTLIGKSIGGTAVSLLARTRPELAAAELVFLTPNLHYPPFAAGLAELEQRSLFVVGDRDPAHEHLEVARGAGEVTVVPDADHGFDVDGSVARSLAAVAAAVDAVGAFLRAGG